MNNRHDRHYCFEDSMFVGTPERLKPHSDGQMVNTMTLFGEKKNVSGVCNALDSSLFRPGEIFKLVTIRVHLGFFGCQGAAVWNTEPVVIDDKILMALAINQLHFTLRMKETDIMKWPAWYTPAGGGIVGSTSVASSGGDASAGIAPVVARSFVGTNGEATPRAAMQLAEPINVDSDGLFEINVQASQQGDADFVNALNGLTQGFAVGKVLVDGFFTTMVD